VKITAEELRKRYADMSDEELQSLDRSDLMDLARQCYDEEVAQRGLKRRRAAPMETADPLPDTDVELEEPVAVAVYTFPADARIARALIRAQKIPCYIENEHVASTLAASIGLGLRVMVPANFANQARELLDDMVTDAEAPEGWDGEVRERDVQTNGIRMHVTEAGTGRLVLLLHGFPEGRNAWQHQVDAIAAEGYHVVAPDLRGYGQTERPEALEAYDIFQLTADIVGLVDALDGAPAVVAGHDWGAMIAWHCALLRPDLFRAVALLSVPFVPRRDVSQSQWEQRHYPGKIFYQAMFRAPGAEQFFAMDVRARLLAGLWTLSGDVPREQRWRPVRDADAPLTLPQVPNALPPWLAEEDLDSMVSEFQHAGFTGGLNYYRNMDRNWALTPFLDGAKLLQRTVFIAGSEDPVLDFLHDELAELDLNVPNLWKKAVIKGAGHWIQQERPKEVNRLLLAFLNDLEAGERSA
jgi:pimeloyl-ACP methyl ester carboxylesterase